MLRLWGCGLACRAADLEVDGRQPSVHGPAGDELGPEGPKFSPPPGDMVTVAHSAGPVGQSGGHRAPATADGAARFPRGRGGGAPVRAHPRDPRFLADRASNAFSRMTGRPRVSRSGPSHRAAPAPRPSWQPAVRAGSLASRRRWWSSYQAVSRLGPGWVLAGEWRIGTTDWPSVSVESGHGELGSRAMSYQGPHRRRSLATASSGGLGSGLIQGP